MLDVEGEPSTLRAMTFLGLDDRTWILFSAVLYAAGFLTGVVALLRSRRKAAGFMYALAALGFGLQTLGLHLRGMETHGCPLGNRFEILQFTVWSMMLLYFVVGPTFRLSVLGYFTAGLATLLSSASLAVPPWDSAVRVRVFGGNPFIELHAALAMFSYGVFALLALTSVMYLLQWRNLRRKNLHRMFSLLPSILELDQMNVRLAGFGTALLSFALGVGSVYWAADWASVNPLKLGATVAVWAGYLIVFVLRLRQKLIAQRFAWVCLALFALTLFSLGTLNSPRRIDLVPGAAPTEVKHP